jgi:hypothetical protein
MKRTEQTELLDLSFDTVTMETAVAPWIGSPPIGPIRARAGL